MKITLKRKHFEIASHYSRMMGGNGNSSQDDVRELFEYESYGRTENGNLPRLLEGKAKHDLLVWMVLEECFYYWSQCWGWALPIEDMALDGHPLVVQSLRNWEAKAMVAGIPTMLRQNQNVTPERCERTMQERQRNLRRSHKPLSSEQREWWLKQWQYINGATI